MSKVQLILPKMGESVEEATVISWLKDIGDKINVDDLVVEIATDKVDSEVPSDVSGVLIEKLCKVNDVVKVGHPLAIIETDNLIKEEINLDKAKKTESIKDETKILISNAKKIIEVPKEYSNNKSYSPLVRNIAKKEGLIESDLEKIKGTGKNGRVTKNDLLYYLSQRNGDESNVLNIDRTDFVEKNSDGVYEMSRMEKLISDHMMHSQKESAHVQAFIEADITKIWNWREKNKKIFNDREGEKITFTPIFIMLVAQVLKEFPILNSSLDKYNVIKKKDINIGMATALSDGSLIVPVIKNADQLSLTGLVKKVNDLATRSRSGQLEPEEVNGGTYTISNVGVFETLMGTPIINQPQVGILAFGAIRKSPSVIETNHGDFIGIRNKIILSHSFDHRIVNGAMGGMFIKRIKDLIENWESSMSI
ncbi:MAG: 2-oxo acid dehydrogenase subunit E2 [Cryomorphaceae bacterium]|nr:MAG: 2-oxo acid dehydrogenase subunit E2 [Cryomorphaceae bacterium]|tara:strand:- start:485 stop:1750 length:1266 start_codon:yes stop_codon:yes gene_type:complete